MERIVLVSAKQLSKPYQTKLNVHTKHTKLNATEKGRYDIKRFLSTMFVLFVNLSQTELNSKYFIFSS